MAEVANTTRRFVGVLLDRKGEVKWVSLGDAVRLYLPDIKRVRAGADRLRGLRLIAARPTPLTQENNKPSLAGDFKTDLEKLRLDAVVEIDASRAGVDGSLVLGYLAKSNIHGVTSVSTKTEYYNSIHNLKEPFPIFLQAVIQDISNQSAKRKSGPAREKAILVGVYKDGRAKGSVSMAELSELARSAKVDIVEEVTQFNRKLAPKTVIGLGKLEDICLRALSLGVETIIFDRDLTPSQLLNITDMTDLKILDRTMLILDIFAQRAVTKEGKLQVEMAQLSYSLPRLAKKQTGLSRLTGGIGGRGPGETKLEVNKRRVKDRLARLADELEKIKKQRELRRKVRKVNLLPTIAIVGYTNAGKSTLLNALSGSDIYAKDELFATLDPHSRRLRFPYDQEVLVTDTVGFIDHLPKSLMQAFMATLEELNDADLLLHVVDVVNPNYLQQIEVVNKVLKELDLLSKPILLVLNKVDLLSKTDGDERERFLDGIEVSAKKKIGFNELIDRSCSALLQMGKIIPGKEKKRYLFKGEI